MISWSNSYKTFLSITIWCLLWYSVSYYSEYYLEQKTAKIPKSIEEELNKTNAVEKSNEGSRSMANLQNKKSIKLFYWKPYPISSVELDNFGDRLSFELVKRIVGPHLQSAVSYNQTDEKRLLAIGSIIHYARNGDVIWGSGILYYSSPVKSNLDIRAVRGPLTWQKITKMYPKLNVPQIYGDPALLVPYFFPEFKKSLSPKYEYTIIPHMHEQKFEVFSSQNKNVIYPTENWNLVIRRIVNSKFVISSSLHGIILAESFGIPARFLRLNIKKNLFKYTDYYYGTERFNFKYATSVKEALQMGGEPPFKCDLQMLYDAFPREYFGNKLIYDRLPQL